MATGLGGPSGLEDSPLQSSRAKTGNARRVPEESIDSIQQNTFFSYGDEGTNIDTCPQAHERFKSTFLRKASQKVTGLNWRDTRRGEPPFHHLPLLCEDAAEMTEYVSLALKRAAKEAAVLQRSHHMWRRL